MAYKFDRAEQLEGGRELVHYDGPGDLKAMVTRRDGDLDSVEVFFWDGARGRDRVATVYCSESSGATMSGQSFSFRSAPEAERFIDAMLVASTWFALARIEADARRRESGQAHAS